MRGLIHMEATNLTAGLDPLRCSIMAGDEQYFFTISVALLLSLSASIYKVFLQLFHAFESLVSREHL